MPEGGTVLWLWDRFTQRSGRHAPLREIGETVPGRRRSGGQALCVLDVGLGLHFQTDGTLRPQQCGQTQERRQAAYDLSTDWWVTLGRRFISIQ